MSDIAVSTNVISRNNIGQFIAACNQAAGATARELVENGAQYSRDLAPVGSKPDLRTIPLAQSIFTHMISATQGNWYSVARHALHQEYGTMPHDIPANVQFFWDNMGRWWMTPEVYLAKTGHYGADPIKHPGHGEQQFLRPAYKRVMAEAMAVARRHYP